MECARGSGLEGVVRSFERASGRGAILADTGREVFVFARELPAKARTAGARVRFELEKRDGREQAVRVRLAPQDGPAPSRAVQRPDRIPAGGAVGVAARVTRTRDAGLRPVRSTSARRLVLAWTAGVASHDVDALLALYHTDAVLHFGGVEWVGERQLRIGLLDSRVVGRAWQADAHWHGMLLVIRRQVQSTRHHAETHVRLSKGLIQEQWLFVAR